MKIIKKVREVTIPNKYLDLYKNLIIVTDGRSLDQIDSNLDIIPLLQGNIFSLKILGDKLFYQLDNNTNLHIYSKDIILSGDYGYVLHSALECASYIYIYGGKDKTTLFLDINLKFVEKAPMYCNFSYEDYLFNVNKDRVICYQLNNKLWDYQHTDNFKIHIISGYKDTVLIYSENGDLFSLDLQMGKLCWKFGEKILTLNSLYGDYLYSLNRENLLEISAETGKQIKKIDIKSIEEKEKFLINRIKVYDDYIFCTDTFGTIAMIDRKSLTLKEILRFNNHLINRDYTLQWVNSRLYVQDIEYTIHIFE